MKKLLLFTGMLLMLSGCGSDQPQETTPEEARPVIKEGMEMYSQVFADDVLQEESVDKVVNFGNEDTPLLFHVNQSHTYKGENVPEGKSDMDCSFYSLTEEEYYEFIQLFAIMRGISTTTELSDEQKLAAFTELAKLLYDSKIELALLIYLIDNQPEELAAIYGMIQDASGTRSGQNDLNSIMTSMICADIKPTALKMELDNKGISFNDFLTDANLAGIDISGMIQTRMGVVEIVKAVVDGVVLLSKLIVAFVENAKPVVDIENTYVSYLHEEDLDPLNYYGADRIKSKTYECRYGTKEVPMAQCKFSVEAYIHAAHKEFKYAFIPRVGMMVERVRCTAGMHVEGSVAYSPGYTTYTPNGPVAYGEHDITIEYGDILCFARTARLHYIIHGVNGFEYVEWKSK